MLDLDDLEAKAIAAIYYCRSASWAEFMVTSDPEWSAAARPDIVIALIRELREARAAVVAEREACAKVAAKIGDDLDEDGRIFLPCEVAYRCESAIRARGEKGGE